MDNNNLETISEAIEALEKNRLSKEIIDIHTSLTNALDKKELGAIDEVAFRTYFAKPIYKFMCGLELTEKEKHYFNKYIELGSMYDPVEITNHLGNVLYLAPPLMEKPELTEDNKLNNYYKLVATYNNKHDRTPMEAKSYINDKLNTINPIIYEPEGGVVKQWLELFKRYEDGYVDNKDTSKEQNTTNNTTNKVEDLGLCYD